MTSRISFSDLVKSELKKSSWLLAFQALAFGLAMPFKVLLILTIRKNEIAKKALEWDLQKIFGEIAGFGQIENICLIVAAGILCALAGFAYLYSPVKLDFYHSLPLKRETLFKVKITGSFLTFLIPYVICQGLELLIGTFYRVVSGTTALEMLVNTLEGILYFLCSYSGTLLAIMLTGKLVTAILALGTLAGYVPILYVIFQALEALFMPNSINREILFAENLLIRSSPWAMCTVGGNVKSRLQNGTTGYWPAIPYLCEVAAVTVLLFFVTRWMYKKRKTEVAGSALAFKQTEGVVKILLSVPASIGAAIIAYEVMDSTLWEIAFILLFGILACAIMEFIYRMDIRQILSHKSHMAVTVILAAGLFLFVKFDMAGYNSYVPEKSEVQSMAITNGQLGIQYDIGDGYPTSYRYGVDPDVLDYFETDDFSLIYEIAKESAEFRSNDIDFEQKCRIGIKYTLKNGKEVYREYWADKERYLNLMDALCTNESYREKLFPILGWDEAMAEGMRAYYFVPESQMETYYERDLFSPEDIWMVVQAYKEDLEQMNFSELFRSNGELFFQNTGENTVYYGSYPLNMEFEHTIDALAQIKADE